MLLDTSNGLYLGAGLNTNNENLEEKNKETDNTVNTIKTKLNGIEIDKFRGTPSHLEDLLNKGYILGIVVNKSLMEYKKNSNLDAAYQKNAFIKLSYPDSKGEIRVYFDVETKEDGTVDKLYIYSGKLKQEVSPEKQETLFKHFSQDVNMYRK